ncbi:MAG: PIN domain-containing protein [Bacteroidota bacterium]
MDIYIVDTNLLYSSILKPNNRIASFILEADRYDVRLFAPKYLEVEIARYKPSIQQASGYSDQEFEVVKNQLFSSITFIDDDIIPFEEWVKALRTVRDIDVNDVNFVALNNYLDKLLWTGHKKLYEGLRQKGYPNVVMFDFIKEKYGLVR